MDTVNNLIDSLDEILSALEDLNDSDDYHLALEVGYHFRDELQTLSED